MKVTFKKRVPCVCGRDTDHEHHTLERYMLSEYDGDEILSQTFKHGYDEEDDHIYKFIEEVHKSQEDGGEIPRKITVSLIRQEVV